jgi:hypothetical protein
MTEKRIGNIRDDIQGIIQTMAHLQRIVAEYESTDHYHNYVDAKKTIKAMDAEVRQLAIECYEDTEAKHPHAAVSIKMRTVLDYDISEARCFAFDNGYPELLKIRQMDTLRAIETLMSEAPLVLEADTKAFEKAIKIMVALPDFVTETKEPFANIAKDLSEFVK